MTTTYAVLANGSDGELLAEVEYPAVLVSFAFDGKGQMRRALQHRPQQLMLDSGAFSAWGSGESVDIDALAEWARGWQADYPGAELLNLDDIPGTPSTPPGPRALLDSIAESARNAEQLRAGGLSVVEVFHLYEPLSALAGIVGRRRPGERIALGGLARWTGGPGGPIKRRFCRAAFGYLTRDDGSVPAVHGLGVSPDSQWIGSAQFPWASVDSTSWTSMSRFGVGVTRAGKRLGGRSDSRAGNRKLGKLYSLRVLDAWANPDRYAPLWDGRGVVIRD